MNIRLSSAALLSVAAVLAAACGESPTMPTAVVPAPSFAKSSGGGGGGSHGGGGGSLTRIGLTVTFDDSYSGVVSDGLGPYVDSGDADTGIFAFTNNGNDQPGLFDPSPTNCGPDACPRRVVIGEQTTDAEFHVWDLTMSAGIQTIETRVGIGIQTASVRSALGCDHLIYDDAAYSVADGGVDENGTVTLTSVDATTGKRTWTVTGDWAWCENVSAHGGKLSTSGAVHMPFSFTMTEQ